jgi:hypothetical protein
MRTNVGKTVTEYAAGTPDSSPKITGYANGFVFRNFSRGRYRSAASRLQHNAIECMYVALLAVLLWVPFKLLNVRVPIVAGVLACVLMILDAVPLARS